MTFEDKIRTLERRVRRCELVVLVWGPGQEGGEHFEKRRKLREAVAVQFPQADVRFSEDLSSAGLPAGIEHLQPHEQELWHLAACDICVVLDTSKGAGEEIAHFAVRPALARKLFILTNERYMNSSSFPAGLRRYQNQQFYGDVEYDSCQTVERALARLRQVALEKLLDETAL